MNTGDRVSFINDRLNGTIIRRIDRHKVLVALDDGFEIPVDVAELVLISQTPANAARISEDSERLLADSAVKEEKIWLAFSAEGSKLGKPEIKVYLINTRPETLLYTVYVSHAGKVKGISKGEMEQSEAIPVGSFGLDQADEWRNWHVQILSFSRNPEEVPLPLHFPLRIRPASLLKGGQEIPVLGKEGLLFTLDNKPQGQKPGEAEGAGQVLTPYKDPFTHIENVGDVVDLHIEEIMGGPVQLPAEAILQKQVEHFRNTLEKAFAFGMSKVIFIHGIGNGKLKQEIRKILGSEFSAEKWEDADPKKFGYGATAVYLKNR
jgi:hypothetical protein